MMQVPLGTSRLVLGGGDPGKLPEVASQVGLVRVSGRDGELCQIAICARRQELQDAVESLDPVVVFGSQTDSCPEQRYEMPRAITRLALNVFDSNRSSGSSGLQGVRDDRVHEERSLQAGAELLLENAKDLLWRGACHQSLVQIFPVSAPQR